MVKKKVNKYELFLCYRHLPEDIDAIGFYFLRVSTDPIPMPSSQAEAMSILTPCFETGTTGPKPLTELEKLLGHLYIPMFMLQGKYTSIKIVITGFRLRGGSVGEAPHPQLSFPPKNANL